MDLLVLYKEERQELICYDPFITPEFVDVYDPFLASDFELPVLRFDFHYIAPQTDIWMLLVLLFSLHFSDLVLLFDFLLFPDIE